MQRKTRLRTTISWPSRMVYSMETWPCYNLMATSNAMNMAQMCGGCNQNIVSSRVQFYGQPYNPSTIEGIHLDTRISIDKVCIPLPSKA